MFRLWAAGEAVDYPVHGLTSLLDVPTAKLPDGIEATYPVADVPAVLRAARATADLLERAGLHAADLRTPLDVFVRARLNAIDAT